MPSDLNMGEGNLEGGTEEYRGVLFMAHSYWQDLYMSPSRIKCLGTLSVISL